MSWIHLTSKFGNYCSSCQGRVNKGSEIFWNNDGSSKVKHYLCGLKPQNSEESVDSNVVDLGTMPTVEFVSDLEEEPQTEADRIRAKVMGLPSKKENEWFEKRKEERRFRMENFSP